MKTMRLLALVLCVTIVATACAPKIQNAPKNDKQRHERAADKGFKDLDNNKR